MCTYQRLSAQTEPASDRPSERARERPSCRHTHKERGREGEKERPGERERERDRESPPAAVGVNESAMLNWEAFSQAGGQAGGQGEREIGSFAPPRSCWQPATPLNLVHSPIVAQPCPRLTDCLSVCLPVSPPLPSPLLSSPLVSSLPFPPPLSYACRSATTALFLRPMHSLVTSDERMWDQFSAAASCRTRPRAHTHTRTHTHTYSRHAGTGPHERADEREGERGEESERLL